MVGLDPYRVLRVRRSAKLLEIQSAYRALAQKFHPDHNPHDVVLAAARFRELQEAYEILSDPTRRRAHDASLKLRLRERDMWRAAFGLTGGGGGIRSIDFDGLGPTGPGSVMGVVPVSTDGGVLSGSIALCDSFLKSGVNTILRIVIWGDVCITCKGKGFRSGKSVCDHCRGTGQISSPQPAWSTPGVVIGCCPRCEGCGMLSVVSCVECSGWGRYRGRQRLQVKIEPGTRVGQTLRLKGQGRHLGGRLFGDLLIKTVRDMGATRWDESGNVYSTLSLSLTQAILGDKVLVPTLFGGFVRLSIPNSVQPGTVLCLRGRGWRPNPNAIRGQHYITLRVLVPSLSSSSERRRVRALFGGASGRSFEEPVGEGYFSRGS
jgi:molecular chaperone DnaJ